MFGEMASELAAAGGRLDAYTAAKQAYEDLLRHREDDRVNSRKVAVLRGGGRGEGGRSEGGGGEGGRSEVGGGEGGRWWQRRG